MGMTWAYMDSEWLNWFMKHNFYVERYRKSDMPHWDSFVSSSKVSHFMFYRRYMDYHADRFEDHSLLIRNAKGNICALLPANKSGASLHSHQGLTFGGLVYAKLSQTSLVEIFSCILAYLRLNSFERLFYKPMPSIYLLSPFQEDLFALHQLGASLSKRDVSSAVTSPVVYNKVRRRIIKKSNALDILCSQSTDLEGFWILLKEVLKSRHSVEPVHTLKEIKYLSRSFPENIRLFTASIGSELLSGAVVYENDRVAHTQYLANSPKGRELGGLDVLLDRLIRDVYKSKAYFDFGTSTERDGMVLNEGLISYKESFGATSVLYDSYELAFK